MSQTHDRPSPNTPSDKVTRRGFLAGAGTAAFSFTMLQPHLVGSYAANTKVKLGLIGCGGRGTWIAALFMKHGGYDVVAAFDYFQDRVDAFGGKFNVAQSRRFTGLSGYRRLLETDVDAVAIESPPYFHPEQAAAAADAGKHVYLAKPIAVDVPGCNTVADSGKKSTANKHCFLIDFQTRADPFFQEALKRVREGALGEFAFGEATYHAGDPWLGQHKALDVDPDNTENRLRAWGLDKVLSGDVITEQNIHTLDVASWIMGEPPVSAYGTGGATVRKRGTCWDHFALVFLYPKNVAITFSSRQFEAHGTQPEGIRNRMFGKDGVLETEYGGQVLIRGKNFYRGGSSPGIYEEGAAANIATFHKDITDSNYANPTVEPSVRSNLVTILGRTAAYEKRVVTWDEIVKDKTQLDPNLKGAKG
jgi:myo-inositol 2-dehydrogenase/D-chiro-inositol 1-dehydrogenase